MRSASLLLCGVMLAGSAHAAVRARDARPADWRAVIEDRDRDRLRQWRQTWLDGLASARAGGAGAALAEEGALLRPDAGLADPMLPDGLYSCRTVKLGRPVGMTNPPFVRMAPQPCAFRANRLTVVGGGQRPSGWLWSFDGVRLLFLGAMGLGDERQAMPYGRDRERNLIGFVERIGDGHWRLVLPHPQWEALIEVVDIRPASTGPVGAAATAGAE